MTEMDRRWWTGAGREEPLVVAFAAAMAGIAADKYLGGEAWWWCVAAALGGAGWWWSWRRGQRMIAVRCGLIGFAALAALWHHGWWRFYRTDELGLAVAARPIPVCVEAIVTDSPRVQPAPPRDWLNTIPEEPATLLSLQAKRVRDGNCWRTASGNMAVRVACPLTESTTLRTLGTGDRIVVFGHLSAPSPPLNPGEPDFREYERSQRRLCRLQVESEAAIRVLSKGSRWRLFGWLHWARGVCDGHLWEYVRAERAPLASAILLGTREQIDRARNDQFMMTGTVHLLSISGLHVGILAYGFWWLARLGWLSRKGTLVGAMVFVALYALFTDAEPPVVRSAVLICVMCLSRLLGKRAWSANSLAGAGLIVLGINPTSFFQAGTQLSFLAVGTMAGLPVWWGTPPPPDPLERLIAASRSWPETCIRWLTGMVRDALLVSFAIWWTALPLVMYRFHLVSPLAIVLNPIVCLPMTAVLFAGLGVMAFGSVAPFLARWCGACCDWGLWMMESCVEFAAGVPGDHWWTPSPPGWWVAVFYASILAAWWLPALRPPKRWCLAAALWWTALGIWLTQGPVARPASSDELRATFVSVGHGTSLLLELPGGHCILYDAGRMGTAATGARSISSVLWERKISHLDAIIVSHSDADHFNAIPELLRRFSVGVVYGPSEWSNRSQVRRSESPAVREVRQAIRRAGVPIRPLVSGDRLKTGDNCQLLVLHPPSEGLAGSDNANSIVLSIECWGRRILLPGDLESAGMIRLLSLEPHDCDVVMAPHHGSTGSNPSGFAAWSTPEVVVISGGTHRDSTQVVEAYTRAGSQVLHTAFDGAITVRFRSEGSNFVPFRHRR